MFDSSFERGENNTEKRKGRRLKHKEIRKVEQQNDQPKRRRVVRKSRKMGAEICQKKKEPERNYCQSFF